MCLEDIVTDTAVMQVEMNLFRKRNILAFSDGQEEVINFIPRRDDRASFPPL